MSLEHQPGIIPKNEVLKHLKGAYAIGETDLKKAKTQKDKAACTVALKLYASILHYLNENNNDNDPHQQPNASAV